MEKTIKYLLTSVLVVMMSLSCSEDKIDSTGIGILKGKAVTLGTNEPIENVKISTNPVTSVVFTDAQGNFRITGMPVGDYSVKAEKDELLTQFEGTTVIADVEVSVIFEMDVETANNRPPSAPELISPSDNTINLNIEVDLEWSAIDDDGDDLTFSVELRNDQNSDVLTFEDIADTTYTVSGLMYGTKYFWQVFASDAINSPVASTISAFETIELQDNRFLFVRNINGNNVIFSSDEDGNEFQLTSENTNSWRPRKANAIDKIAFLRSNGGDIQLYTMSLDGSNITQLTSTIPVAGFNAEELDFSWRWNDIAIIYTNFDKLYSISSNGGGASLIYTTPNGHLISECDWNGNATRIALKTNDINGYNVEIYTINNAGNIVDTVLSGVSGGAGGLDWSADSGKLLYTYDVSEFENTTYRQLDSRVFVYDFATMMATDQSISKPAGSNDLDARFSPNEAEIILVNTSNDGVSQNDIYRITINNNVRNILFSNSKMPDWK